MWGAYQFGRPSSTRLSEPYLVDSAPTPAKAAVAISNEIMHLVSDFVRNWSSLHLPA
jgi:hypothetical protein